MSIAAMKQALDALENHTAIKHPQQRHYRDSAIDALCVAIEQAEKQEPVGWVECDGVVVWYNRDAAIGRDLYTAPQPRQWQGLTEQEAINAAVYVFCRFAFSPEEQEQIGRNLIKACNDPNSALMLFAATIQELLEEKNT